MKRTVSLIPSATEIVCALGFEDHLVGRSHECDYPEFVKHLPPCTEPKFDPAGSSREVHERVQALLQDALSVYRVDVEKLQGLQPDVIITQAQCEVCAVSLQDVERAVATWVGSQPSLVSLSPRRLMDVWSDITRVAEALGDPDRGAALTDGLQARVRTIGERTKAIPTRPTVACLEWFDPLMATAHWVPELVSLAGGQNLFGMAGQSAPMLTWEALQESDPDILLLMPCGFDIPRIRQELELLTGQPAWSGLKAVRSGRVYLTDGNQYFNRSGPRLVESLEIVAEIFHPSVFQFDHEGIGWERLSS
ncbi:MAG: cobalamin-binding protein [Nitrospirota bacterium]|nr:cobalamin-binding protein [Nitrospirota bacterium]